MDENPSSQYTVTVTVVSPISSLVDLAKQAFPNNGNPNLQIILDHLKAGVRVYHLTELGLFHFVSRGNDCACYQGAWKYQ